MPEGSIATAAAQSKKGGGGWDDFDYLKLKDGESATVRPLMNEAPVGDHPGFQWAYMHETLPRGRAKWGDNEPCLDQAGDGSKACPGCETGRDRYFLGYLAVIWRNGPVYGVTENKVGDKTYKNKDYKKIVGHQDGIFLWERGIRDFTELAGKDATYKGLMTRDFVIKRTGSGAEDTKYHIEPAVDENGNSTATPMTEADRKLYAAWVADGNLDKLKAKVEPRTYAQVNPLFRNVSGASDDGSAADPPASASEPTNLFDQVPDVSAFSQTRDA